MQLTNTDQATLVDMADISVLVVDDEKRIRNACLTMLTQDGYSADVAQDVETGLSLLAEKHFDIILLDLMMPGISGLEALVKIRALHPDTVVIVITGYATLEHSIEAMKNGAFDFISKPFSPNDLRVVLTKAVEFTQTLQGIANEKSRIKALINHLADGVLATDVNKRIALVNPAFLILTGCECHDCIGKPMHAVMPLSTIHEMITDALNLSADDRTEIVQELHIAKTDTYLQARCVPFRDRPGRLLGVVTVVNDITSLKMMDKLKSNFVHMVSHEIRSPLNSVLMQIKVVTDGLVGELTDKQAHIMNRVTERVKGLVNLSTELLDLSKIESGSVYADREEVDISILLKEEVEFAAPKAHEKSLELFLAPLGPLPMMCINRLGMEEVVSNLVNNAIKYTPEGGRIDLSAESDGELLTIQVKDTGIGIPAADLDSIFNRFYRVKNKATRFIVGTGLGLSIVKSIVEAHNGSIQAESREGRGSTFTVALPL